MEWWEAKPAGYDRTRLQMESSTGGDCDVSWSNGLTQRLSDLRPLLKAVTDHAGKLTRQRGTSVTNLEAAADLDDQRGSLSMHQFLRALQKGTWDIQQAAHASPSKQSVAA